MIVRDEHHQLEKCLQSIRPYVKHIAIVDTGSTDNSVSIARRYADVVETFTDCNNSRGIIQRFDIARNRAFSHSTQPWTMWVDGDDEVVGAENLAKLCEEYDRERNGNPSMVMMPYEYSRDHTGRVNMILERERLISPREHFEWRGWVHEVIVPLGADLRKHTSEVKIVHHRDSSNKKIESGRNLRILRDQYAALGDGDARHLYYLGMEYGNNGLIDDAIAFLTKYMDRSGWDDEKYMAAQLIAVHHINRCEYGKAIEWGMKAILIHENWGEAYFTVAKCCYLMAQRGNNEFRWWERCVYFSRVGLEKPPTQTMLFVNPLDRDVEIHRFYNFALSKLGDTKGALDSINTALKTVPNDEQLLFNKKVFDEHVAVGEFIEKLDHLQNIGKISKEVRNSIETIRQNNKVPEYQNTIQSQSHFLSDFNIQTLEESTRSREKLDIIFYVGYGVEAWNPDTVKKSGIGGSETAVIEMSRRLAAFGHRVRVYGDCCSITTRPGPTVEGVFDKVEYFDYSKFHDLECDVLIVSRRPEAIDKNIQYKYSALWVHDVHCGVSLTRERADKFDRILVLSDWHFNFMLQQYSFLDKNKLFKTRNGIDLSRFSHKIIRNSHRAIYSSSPDRGMETAIKIWPSVRNVIPDAELHLYYGFKTWKACADTAQLKTIADLERLIELHKNSGVIFHDRVPQDELAIDFLRSGVWCYPTWFSETSCLTAMEAQAAGCYIVTSPIAALNETVGDRGYMISGDWLSQDYKTKFTNAVINEMRRNDDDRIKLQTYARDNFGWDSLAKDWDEMLHNGMDSPFNIPSYQAV